MKKTVLYVVLLVVVSLVVGTIIGMGIGRRGPYKNMGLRERARFEYGKPGPKDLKGRAGLLEKISDRLKLTEDQKVKIKEILEDSREEIKEAREASINKFKEIKEETDIKIRAILNPQQEKEFEKMVAEVKERFEKFRELKGRKPPLDQEHFEPGHGPEQE
jgi:Spy/CpxP family protein refolding chaperone